MGALLIQIANFFDVVMKVGVGREQGKGWEGGILKKKKCRFGPNVVIFFFFGNNYNNRTLLDKVFFVTVVVHYFFFFVEVTMSTRGLGHFLSKMYTGAAHSSYTIPVVLLLFLFFFFYHYHYQNK